MKFNTSCTAPWALAAMGGFLLCSAPPAGAQLPSGASSVHINFQPPGAPAPSGYLTDTGNAYGDRGNGFTYGWNRQNTLYRDRDSALSPDQRYDTLIATNRQNWEMAVPNGKYRVHLVVGDALVPLAQYSVNVEGVVVAAGTTTPASRWLEGTVVVNVSDGKLSLTNGYRVASNSLCFLDVDALAPAAPRGLTATAVWVEQCCNAMPMAHVDLAWAAVEGATGYNVYRDGVRIQQGVTTLTYKDMPVTSGQTYTYAVTAVGPGGESAKSAPTTVTAPDPPATPHEGGGTTPVNLRVEGLWQNAPTDMLRWDAVPGALRYNIYRYDVLIAGGVTGTSYTLPPSVFSGDLTYTVTAVDAMGMESLPSAIAHTVGAFNPNSLPGWVDWTPGTPDNLAAKSEWNVGKPRLRLTWEHGNSPYNVYRNGQKIAGGITRLYYLDEAVTAGQTYSYTVTSVNAYLPTPREGLRSAPVTAQAPVGPVSSGPSTQVAITQIIPNDDSVTVIFEPVPGASDYRLYDVAIPGKVKYAGLRTNQTNLSNNPYPPTALAIDWNGVDPARGADLILEAVDKLGPFQKMDGDFGPGAMQMDGMMKMSINGQGDPSNVPNVIARSDVFHVSCAPRTLSGAQAFFDNFRNSQPFNLVPKASQDGTLAAAGPGNYGELQNDKWLIRNYLGDQVNTRVFVMSNHFMDTFYDGGGPGSSLAPHTGYASLVMVPKASADISGGRVLHITFEVDAHFSSRRWCDVFVGAVGDTLLTPGKFEEGGDGNATASGSVFRWQITNNGHGVQLFLGGRRQDLFQPANWDDGQTMARTLWDNRTPLANGTAQNLDKRHRFDLYLSRDRYRVVETTPDSKYSLVREKQFPAGVVLPFDKCQVYFAHQFYHSALDRNELIAYSPFEAYWYNHRPFADERHWDNMGFEVLTGFPQ